MRNLISASMSFRLIGIVESSLGNGWRALGFNVAMRTRAAYGQMDTVGFMVREARV